MIKRLASLTHHASLRGFLVLVLLSGLLVAANWSRRPAAPHRTAAEYIEPADDVDIESATVNVTITEPQLSINSVTFTPPKLMIIQGTKFGASPRLLVNGVDRNEFIKNSNDSQINVKGKAKNLGLKPGDNSVQVINASGTASNTFTLVF